MEVCYTEDYNCMGLIWTMPCQLELGFSYYYLVGRKDRFLLQMKGDKGNWLWLYSRVVNKLKMSAYIIHEACSSLLLNKKTTQFLSPNHLLSPSLYFFWWATNTFPWTISLYILDSKLLWTYSPSILTEKKNNFRFKHWSL